MEDCSSSNECRASSIEEAKGSFPRCRTPGPPRLEPLQRNPQSTEERRSHPGDGIADRKMYVAFNEKVRPPRKQKYRVLSRANFCLGISANVPITVSKPVERKPRRRSVASIEYRTSTEINASYTDESSKEEQSLMDKKATRKLSVDNLDQLICPRKECDAEILVCNRRRVRSHSFSNDLTTDYSSANADVVSQKRSTVRSSLPHIQLENTSQKHAPMNKCYSIAVLDEVSSVDERSC